MTTSDKLALAALAMSGLALIVTSVGVAVYGRRQTIATERAAPRPHPEVDWQIEPKGQSYLLRNVGAGIATGVRFALPEGDDSVQVRTDGRDVVRCNETISFLLTIKWSSGRQVAELPVVWDGHPEPVLVPFPSA